MAEKDTCGDCMYCGTWRCPFGRKLEDEGLDDPARTCKQFTPKVKAEPDFADVVKKVNEQIQQERKQPIPTGWECPRCGRINSPWMMQCPCVAETPWTKPYEPNPLPYLLRHTSTSDPLPPGTVVM